MDRYEIQVAGHLDRRRAHALGCEVLRLLSDGDSVLVFEAVDQAAVYGLLTRLRDAGLVLVAAERQLGSAASDPLDHGASTRSKEDTGVAD